MSLKATRSPCERRGDITSQLEVFCGSGFGRGASPASRVGCAIPLLLFCWSGRRLERGELLIFWFCCSESHFSWKWMQGLVEASPFPKGHLSFRRSFFWEANAHPQWWKIQARKFPLSCRELAAALRLCLPPGAPISSNPLSCSSACVFK